MFVTDALKYAYYPQDIARCYRNLGNYYIQEDNLETALALYKYSMEYDLSPLAYREIIYIQSKDKTLDLTLEECLNIIKSKNIQIGPNPFILENMGKMSEEYEENKLFSQALYFYNLIYNLTKDEKILEKINNCNKQLNNI